MGILKGSVAKLDLIVWVKMGGWIKLGLVWGQFGGFQTSKFSRLLVNKLNSGPPQSRLALVLMLLTSTHF